MFNLLGLAAAIPTTILVFGIIVIVMSVFLIIAVLMQQGKQHNLSGTIAGAADTFFGKTKGSTISKKLSVLTSIVAIIFVIIVLAFYFVQTPNDASDATPETTAAAVAEDTGDTTPADTADTEEAPAADTGDTTPAETGDTAPADTADTTPVDTADTATVTDNAETN